MSKVTYIPHPDGRGYSFDLEAAQDAADELGLRLPVEVREEFIEPGVRGVQTRDHDHHEVLLAARACCARHDHPAAANKTFLHELRHCAQTETRGEAEFAFLARLDRSLHGYDDSLIERDANEWADEAARKYRVIS